MVFDYIAPGIQLLGRFGRLETGIWLFRYNSECMILEMPDTSKNDPFKNPWERIANYIQSENLQLKFLTATHVHTDHFDTFPKFHEQFPNVPIIVNRFFFINSPISDFITAKDLNNLKVLIDIKPSIIFKKTPIYCFKDKKFETHLDGELLYLIHAPKHSRSDTMIIFRGSMISGDWWLGPGDPNANQIPIRTINESISYLIDFTRKKEYRIHSIFSVHANEFRRNINFEALMEETRPI